jgi:hypothetical protein
MIPGLSPRAIEEFRALWRSNYGRDLSREEATVRAQAFLRAYAGMARFVDRLHDSASESSVDDSGSK